MSAEAPSGGGRVEILRRSARLQHLRARAPRWLFVCATAITSLVGLREIVVPEQPPTAPPSAEVGVDRPAEDFALQFARAYLTYDTARPEARERALRPFLTDDLELDAGFVARSGQRRVLWAQVAQSRVAAAGPVIVVAAQTDTEPAPVYLAVSVARGGRGALSLAAYPALVGAPATSRASAPERQEVEERGLIAVARRVVANYLAGEQANLAADLAPGAEISLPSLRLRLRSLEQVSWAEARGSGAVVAAVRAVDERGSIWTLSYELGISERAGRPYVTFIQTIPTSI